MCFWKSLLSLGCVLGWLMTSSCHAFDLPKPIPPNRLAASEPSRSELIDAYNRLKLKVPNSTNVQSLLELAQVEADLGMLDEAISHARSAASNSPEDWQTHAALAKYFLLDRNALAASLQAERARELTKNQKNRAFLLSLLLPALVEHKDLVKADKLSKLEFKKDPKDASVAFYRAWVLSNLATSSESRQAAISTYRQAIALNPLVSASHYNLALLLLDENDRQAAISELKSCVTGLKDASTAKLAEELISKLSHQD